MTFDEELQRACSDVVDAFRATSTAIEALPPDIRKLVKCVLTIDADGFEHTLTADGAGLPEDDPPPAEGWTATEPGRYPRIIEVRTKDDPEVGLAEFRDGEWLHSWAGDGMSGIGSPWPVHWLWREQPDEVEEYAREFLESADGESTAEALGALLGGGWTAGEPADKERRYRVRLVGREVVGAVVYWRAGSWRHPGNHGPIDWPDGFEHKVES